MKPQLPRILSIAACLAFSTAIATAIPSTQRVAEGCILAVNPSAQSLTFQRADNQKRFVLTWNQRTLFILADGRDPAILKPGQRVRLSYGLPLFGPDYVRRVVLLPGTVVPPAKAAPARHHFTWSPEYKIQPHPCK